MRSSMRRRSSARWRSPLRAGRNPRNKNSSLGRPEADRAASSADGPGMGTTGMWWRIARVTRRWPGSETNGMPASLTSATVGAAFHGQHQFGGARQFIVLVIADERLMNFEMIEQLQGVPRIFAGDLVDFLQNAQRAQRDVFQIADGRGHEVEAAAAGPVATIQNARFRSWNWQEVSLACRVGRLRSHAIIGLLYIYAGGRTVPLYEYECTKCHKKTEKIESVAGPHLKKVPALWRQGRAGAIGASDPVQGRGLVCDRLRGEEDRRERTRRRKPAKEVRREEESAQGNARKKLRRKLPRKNRRTRKRAKK